MDHVNPDKSMPQKSPRPQHRKRSQPIPDSREHEGTSGRILPSVFYAGDTIAVAQQLLGCLLVHDERENTTTGRIVETEAYLRQDPAAHSFRGKTRSNRVLFGPPGHAHIFFVYGKHWCMNVVTGRGDQKGAVLLRALEPADGIPVMQERRGTRDIHLLCSGPGRLTQALAITGALNGTPLFGGQLQIRTPGSVPESPMPSDEEIVQTTRIGISKAQDRMYRFYLRGNPNVSRK